jgi:hypothetical protein
MKRTHDDFMLSPEDQYERSETLEEAEENPAKLEKVDTLLDATLEKIDEKLGAAQNFLNYSDAQSLLPSSNPSTQSSENSNEKSDNQAQVISSSDFDVDSSHQSKKNRIQKLQCPYCDLKQIFNQTNLAKHIKETHKCKFLFPCFACLDAGIKDIGFNSHAGLTNHKKKYHEKNIGYQCAKCNSIFTYRDNVLTHVKALHSEAKDFKSLMKDYKSLIKKIIIESDTTGQLEQEHRQMPFTAPFTPSTELWDDLFANNSYIQSIENISEKSLSNEQLDTFLTSSESNQASQEEDQASK